MLYGCPCTVISRNPVFLSGGLGLDIPLDSPILKQDIVYKRDRENLARLQKELADLKAHVKEYGVFWKTLGRAHWSRSIPQKYKKYWRYDDEDTEYKLNKQAAQRDEKNLEQQIADQQRAIKESADSALRRLTANFPYKGHVFKPHANSNGTKILFDVTKDDQVLKKDLPKIEEAKAWVDRKIAQEQQKAVDQWEKDRIKNQEIVVSPPAPTQTQTTAAPEKKSNLPLMLGAGAAAVGLVLLTQ